MSDTKKGEQMLGDLEGLCESVAANFGEWLRDQVGKRGEKQAHFATRAGVSRSRLGDWMSDPAPRILPDRLAALAVALELPYETLRKELDEANRAVAMSLAEPDHNVERGTMVSLVEIPIFDRDLAAGHWTPAIFVDDSDITPTQINQGLFRVRLSGDSMQPKYKSGSLVEFRVLRVCREGLVEGGEFYVQRDDDLATFKVVQKIDEEFVTLRAINKKKYPDPMVVERSRIVRCARAVAIITDV